MLLKIIDKLNTNNKRIYGVQYDDGHVVWKDNLPEARFAFASANRKGKRKKSLISKKFKF